MTLNLNDLSNIDYALSVAIKAIEKYNEFDEFDIPTSDLKELQLRIQRELNYENSTTQ